MCCHNNHSYYAHPFLSFLNARQAVTQKFFFMDQPIICLTKLDFHII